MNKQRRAELNAAITSLTELTEEASALQCRVESLIETIECLRDEEQEYKDNMPESLQNGEKGTDADAAIESMESALSAVENLRDALEEFDGDAASSDLDSACGVQ